MNISPFGGIGIIGLVIGLLNKFTFPDLMEVDLYLAIIVAYIFACAPALVTHLIYAKRFSKKKNTILYLLGYGFLSIVVQFGLADNVYTRKFLIVQISFVLVVALGFNILSSIVTALIVSNKSKTDSHEEVIDDGRQ